MFIDLMSIFVDYLEDSSSFPSICNIGFRAYAFLPFIPTDPSVARTFFVTAAC